MNRTKIHFHKDYQELLEEVVNKIQKKSPHCFDTTKNHFNAHIKFRNPLNDVFKSHQPNKNQQQPSDNVQPNSQDSNHQGAESIKQTTYYVFGQSSPAKSVQMQKTFVNLGNNRYLINKDFPMNFNRTGEFSLRSMDHAEMNTFNVNNLTFPVLGSSPKTKRTLLPIHPLNEINSPKSNIAKTKRFSFSKKKDTTKSYPLEINNRLKSKAKNKYQITESFETNPQKQKNPAKMVLTISQIEKRFKLQTNDYLRQVAFSHEYQNKLLDMERNIVQKRRIEKLKNQKLRRQTNEKERIDAWKEQSGNFNATDELYDVFDHIRTKPLF